MRDSYDALRTEGRNVRTADIDRMSTLEMVRTICCENRVVEDAVAAEAENIAAATDIITASLQNGGHLIYVGCGTSGRLGVVDASECPPTFGVDYSLVRGIIAGGNGAMFRAVEGAEDSEERGAQELLEGGVQAGDVVVGISASGRAPYVLGALKQARESGAVPIGLCCNPGSLMESLCDVTVAPYVGPEVISGSTRLKAGTATKLVLNMFSTCAMIKTGKVRGNLMINVRPTNEKLIERATRIIISVTGCGRDTASAALEKYGDVPAALGAIEKGEFSDETT